MHAEAKTQLLRIRIEEKQRKLVCRSDVDDLIDQIAGIVLTHLSGMSARCSRDMQVRRNIDAVVMQSGARSVRRAARQRTNAVSRR